MSSRSYLAEDDGSVHFKLHVSKNGNLVATVLPHDERPSYELIIGGPEWQRGKGYRYHGHIRVAARELIEGMQKAVQRTLPESEELSICHFHNHPERQCDTWGNKVFLWEVEEIVKGIVETRVLALCRLCAGYCVSDLGCNVRKVS